MCLCLYSNYKHAPHVISTNKGVFLKGPERMIFFFFISYGKKKRFETRASRSVLERFMLVSQGITVFLFSFCVSMYVNSTTGIIGHKAAIKGLSCLKMYAFTLWYFILKTCHFLQSIAAQVRVTPVHGTKKLCKKKSRKIADQWKSVYVMPQTEICIISILSWPPSARVLLSGLLLCSCVFPGSVSGRRVAPQLRPGWGAGESWRAGIERCQWTSETGTAPALLYFSWCTVALWPFLAPGGSGIVRWKWLQ